MRNIHELDNNNKPVSKGYGFVSFKMHEDALLALRNINNNPTVFNKNKVCICFQIPSSPLEIKIVSFSETYRCVLSGKSCRA